MGEKVKDMVIKYNTRNDIYVYGMIYMCIVGIWEACTVQIRCILNLSKRYVCIVFIKINLSVFPCPGECHGDVTWP